MRDLWSDWYINHMRSGGGDTRAPLVAGEVSAVLDGLDKAAYVAFMPMMTELRGATLTDGSYAPIYDLGTDFGDGIPLDGGSRLVWEYQDRWLSQCQQAKYAQTCLSGNVHYLQSALLSSIQTWQGTLMSADADCPMSQQWMPQATMLSSLFTDISSLEGSRQHPWWTSEPYGSGAYDWRRYTLYAGPYVPCRINWLWYCASWRALFKLVNTPSINIGDWRWINPLRSSSSGVSFSIDYLIDHSFLNSWTVLSSSQDFVQRFDREICGGHAPDLPYMPWSVCGCEIGRMLYSGDGAAVMSDAAMNLPLIVPIDGMRQFFGQPQSWAATYAAVGDIKSKYTDDVKFSTDSLPQQCKTALSIGGDPDFPSNSDKPFSFAAKAYRDAYGAIQEHKLDSNLSSNMCIPPLRLGAQNVLAHQWLWESFLDGKDSQGSPHSGLAYAWTPFTFERMHFFRHYSFYVAGQAKLSHDEDYNWVVDVSQHPISSSWSNFDWRPIAELAPYEPYLADVRPNMVKWDSHSSYTAQVPPQLWPRGYSGISCDFEIPLPLSVDANGAAVFDTTWLSSSGYTRQEWNEIVRIVKSMFPKTKEDKIQKQLSDLYEEYLEEPDGYIPSTIQQIDYTTAELHHYYDLLETLSVDAWYYSWSSTVEEVWPEDYSLAGKFNEGISATSAWSGTDPAPFDNYLSIWDGSYYFQNGYYGFPLSSVDGDFDSGYPSHGTWMDSTKSVFDGLSAYIASSEVYKDGSYYGPYYSDYQLFLMKNAIESMEADLRYNGSEALARVGLRLQDVQTRWPPCRCDVTTDPQTGTETSAFTQDENCWKRVVMDLNDLLEDEASYWYRQSRSALEEAFSQYWYDTSLSGKQQYIDSVSSAVDSTFIAEWQSQYAEAYSTYHQIIQEDISRVQGEIDDLCARVDELSAEYDEKYQDILDNTQDDPLPEKSDLEKLLHYRIDPHAQQLSTQWSAELNMLGVAPDTWSQPLSSYPSTYSKSDEQFYFCIEPRTRWPAYESPAWYTVPVKKTTLEEVTVEGETFLDNVVRAKMFSAYYDGQDMKPFDKFRRDIDTLAEKDEPHGYFGVEWPNPSQFFGTEVRDIQRWDLSVQLSVDIGYGSEGIEDIVDARETMHDHIISVDFDGQMWEAFGLEIFCINGPQFATVDCKEEIRKWSSSTAVEWKFVDGEQQKAEYYGKQPEVGEDYTLPQLSGHLEVEFGHQIIGSLDMPAVYSSM